MTKITIAKALIAASTCNRQDSATVENVKEMGKIISRSLKSDKSKRSYTKDIVLTNEEARVFAR